MEETKLCPILIGATASSRDGISAGGNWGARCKTDDCSWWDNERQSCAVMVISQQLVGISLSDISRQLRSA